MAPRAFCAATSEELGEDAAGTASTVRAFLLLEHGGPWGQAILRDAAFPDDVRAGLQSLSADAGARPMLMRRPGARPGVPQRPRVLLCVSGPGGGTAAETTLDDVRDVLGLPLPELLEDLRAGRTPQGWAPVASFFGTCTHGRHDACCAERGRPVARALHDLVGDAAWEVSHMGGDRFAGNVLALPDGVYYGRVTPRDAAGLVAAHDDGRYVTDLMRGRSCLPFAAQAAEIALRRYVDEDSARAVGLTACRRKGSRTVTTWDVAGRGSWRVVVDTANPGPARSLTCSAEATTPPVHTVVELADATAPGRGVQGWDEAWTGADPDLEASASVVDAVAGLPPGRALDVASGTGRHAVWLSQHGWQVTAVDFSSVAVATGHAATDAAGVAVDWHVGDARVWSPADGHPGYDLVLVAYAALPEVTTRALSWLAPGGRLVVVGHALRNLTEGTGGPHDPRLLHTTESLRRNASGLAVERLEEVVRTSRHGQTVEVVLVARREDGPEAVRP